MAIWIVFLTHMTFYYSVIEADALFTQRKFISSYTGSNSGLMTSVSYEGRTLCSMTLQFCQGHIPDPLAQWPSDIDTLPLSPY